MIEWISVNDDLPEDTEDVLIVEDFGFMVEVFVGWREDGEWLSLSFVEDDDGGNAQLHPTELITHWMPLPEPPQGWTPGLD